MKMVDFLDKSIAIVGNGGSLSGSGLGEKIDSRDIVIRFNNYNTSQTYLKDVGKKTDVWSNTFFCDIVRRPNYNNLIVCPLPLNKEKYKKIYSGTNKSFLSECLINLEFVPESIFLDLCSNLPDHPAIGRPHPSSGLSLIFWLYRLGFEIKESDLFGFDFFLGKHHYFSDMKSPSDNHFGDVERDLIKKILENEI